MGDVCRFFLKGYCRYGTNCRFKHVENNDYRRSNEYSSQYYSPTQDRSNHHNWSSPLSNHSFHENNYDNGYKFNNGVKSTFNFDERSIRKNQFFNSNAGYNKQNEYGNRHKENQYNNTRQSNDKFNAAEVSEREVIKNDMKEWLSSGMWLLSCYTYSKHLPSLPAFEDISPEELRLQAYKSKLTNNFAEYEHRLVKLMLEKKDLINHVSQFSDTVKQQLEMYIMATKNITVNNDGTISNNSFSTYATNSFSLPQAVNLFSFNSAEQITNLPPSSANIFPASSTLKIEPTKTSNTFSFLEGKYIKDNSVVPPTTTGVFNKSKDSRYSNVDELSSNDKKQFEATNFELGKIPLCPPPKELI